MGRRRCCCGATIRRFDAAGNIVWKSDDGVSSASQVRKVTLDSNGQPIVILIDNVQAGGDPVKSVIKYTTAGAEEWTYSVVSTDGSPSYVTTDQSNNVYILTNHPNSASPTTSRIIKLNSSGVFQWISNVARLVWIGVNGSGQLIGLPPTGGVLRTFAGTPAALLSSVSMELPGTFNSTTGMQIASVVGSDLVVAGLGTAITQPSAVGWLFSFPRHASGTYTLTYRGVTSSPITYLQVLPDNLTNTTLPNTQLTQNLTAMINGVHTISTIVEDEQRFGGTFNINGVIGSTNPRFNNGGAHCVYIIWVTGIPTNPPPAVTDLTGNFSGITFTYSPGFTDPFWGPNIQGNPLTTRPGWRLQRFNMATGKTVWLMNSNDVPIEAKSVGFISGGPGPRAYGNQTPIPIQKWIDNTTGSPGTHSVSVEPGGTFLAGGHNNADGFARAYPNGSATPLWDYLWALAPGAPLVAGVTGVAAVDNDTYYAVGTRG